MLALAFRLGFMVSREGFNGECAYDHCGPNTLRADSGMTVKEFFAHMEDSERFKDLTREALDYLANAEVCHADEPPKDQ